MVTRYLIPAVMVGLLIAIVSATYHGVYVFAEMMGPQFAWGFVSAGALAIAAYYVVQWLDKPSGPRH